MTDPADLGVVDAQAALSTRSLSSHELVEACLARIRERDGAHSHDGDPGSVNAWVRVYEEDALEAAARADKLLASGKAPSLCGIPIGLKDLYAVAGKPLTFAFEGRPLMSMPRFLLPVFPAFWGLALGLERLRIPRTVAFVAGAIGLGILSLLTVNWYYIF